MKPLQKNNNIIKRKHDFCLESVDKKEKAVKKSSPNCF